MQSPQLKTLNFRPTFLSHTEAAKDPKSDNGMYMELRESSGRRLTNPIQEPKAKKSKMDWDFTNRKNFFRINLGEDIGIGLLPRICKVIIDTVIFGRLQFIKQLGVVYCVYPDGNHSRRSHSLGTAHLACKFLKNLQEQTINGNPPMTGSEMLCVIIAALCHDLGHGPFSHLCEEFMVQEDGTKITHEQMSVLLFEKLLEDYPGAKRCLEEYFDEYHFTLIKQLIDPPSDDPSTFICGPDKAFLFAIVNNPSSGLDVDKMDYLLRDAKRVGVNGVTRENIEFCLTNAKISEIPKNHFREKFTWLAFPENNPAVVSIFFERRQYLHEIVYSHRTVVAVSEMFRNAIKLSLHEIRISKGEKRDIPLGHCFRRENLDLYIMLTDEYLRTQIMYSNSPAIEEAQQILSDIDNRKFWRPILAFKSLDPTHLDRLKSSALKAELENLELSFNVEEILVVRKDFNAGKGLHVNPMDRIPFYSRDDGKSIRYITNSLKLPFVSTVFIIAPFGCSESDANAIKIIMRKYASDRSIPSPTQLFRNNENSNYA